MYIIGGRVADTADSRVKFVKVLLGAFAKLLRHFCLSVRPFFPMEQLGSHWTDFHEVLYLSIFRKICGENSSFIKI